MTSARQGKRPDILLPYSQIGKYTITCNDNNKIIGINEQIIRCTNAEYKIIKRLSVGQPVSDLALVHELLGCSPDNSTKPSVSKHIEHLREKVRGTGLDIYRIHVYGYLLVEPE
jgi:DNA-binding response OmpR family regulator